MPEMVDPVHLWKKSSSRPFPGGNLLLRLDHRKCRTYIHPTHMAAILANNPLSVLAPTPEDDEAIDSSNARTRFRAQKRIPLPVTNVAFALKSCMARHPMRYGRIMQLKRQRHAQEQSAL